MTKYTKGMIALVILMITVTAFVIWLIHDRFFESTAELTVQEASQMITNLYGGSVESIEEKDDIFYISVVRNNLTYDFQIDTQTGSILQLTKNDNKLPNALTNVKTKEEIQALIMAHQKGSIHSISYQDAAEQPQYIVEILEQENLKTVVMHAITGEILSEEVKQPNTSDNHTLSILSSEQAKQIALSQLNGTVEYVVYEAANDGGYYLVEIDGENQESIFQIHAVSGKVMSVTKEDDDSDDDD
ncbi:PepSY domain-containing protein [Ureibacillus chungkukjangi]|uniref:Peptidase YpeB-like protein n=1 Tax=Ureibacillus chungkukjangi TaxID=1202712 RepID=A0A318TK41_9BACL|nr:PepSY domain-containing protein [Ureibacillus chungkukjangi]MCM3389415.1 PepSY domain-containing protein [Ureibacillus chungkukjangi]PYF05182.1 peptidase YpeB-like protein [Ureibacillus chungkukjangi]